MRAVKITGALVAVLLAAVAVAAPIGPLPGFFIGGTSTPAPAQWGEASAAEEIRLRVPGTPPRVVVIWVVEHGGELYVVGSRSSGWVKRIGSGAPVEMRVGDATYALRARAVAEGFEPILQAYVAKYESDHPDIVAGFPPIDEAHERVAVFQLGRS